MTLPIFNFKNISLTFGQTPIFININGQIAVNEKICLVGRNGSGKSTLLKLMAGLIETDSGELFYKPGIKISYLAQAPLSDKDISVFEYVANAIDAEEREKKSYLADIIIEKLDLNPQERLIKLSGGQLRRANLARALVVEPDLLFLDEPTNHMDIASIEWLEQYLLNYSGGLILVSHDKAFLRNVSNRTVWLDRGKLFYNKNGFSDFERWSEEIYEQERKALSKLGKELDKENLWLQQGVTARRKRNQQRLHNLHDLRAKIQNDKSRFNGLANNIKLESSSVDNQAKLIVEIENVKFKFADQPEDNFIFEEFSLTISKGEIIGVIGKNGAGKSTLIKLITGELNQTSGSIKRGQNLRFSYLDQTRGQISLNKTLWETLCPSGGDTIFVGGKAKHVAAYLKDFLFDSSQINSKVTTLSGGEKNRLLLALLFANPGNFIILDEPTNDLDMETLDMLQEILSDYEGTVLIVSHDRDFLERLVTRTIIVENGKINDFHGGFFQYKSAAFTNVKNIQVGKNVKIAEKQLKKLSYKDERELALLPDKIDQISKHIKSLEAEFINPDLYSKNPESFRKLSAEISLKKEELQTSELRWLELEELKSNY